MHLYPKFHHPMFTRSEVIVLTNKQTHAAENIQRSSLRYDVEWQAPTVSHVSVRASIHQSQPSTRASSSRHMSGLASHDSRMHHSRLSGSRPTAAVRLGCSGLGNNLTKLEVNRNMSIKKTTCLASIAVADLWFAKDFFDVGGVTYSFVYLGSEFVTWTVSDDSTGPVLVQQTVSCAAWCHLYSCLSSLLN